MAKVLIVIKGDVRQGKTLLSTYFELRSKIEPQLSNYPIKDSKYKKLNPEELMELTYPQYVVIIDEVYTFLESYYSSKEISIFLDYVLFQSGKRGIDFIFTLQLLRRLNINFREMWNVMIEAHKGQSSFNYHFYRKKDESVIDFWRSIPMVMAEKIYPLYDTFKVIPPTNIPDLKFGFIKADPIKLKALIEEACLNIQPKIEKVTKDSVKTALIENGYTSKLAQYCYSHLKGEFKDGKISS